MQCVFDEILQAYVLRLEGFFSPEEIVAFLQKNFQTTHCWLICAHQAKFFPNIVIEWIQNHSQPLQKIAFVLSKELFSTEKMQDYNKNLPANIRFFNNLLQARSWIFNT